MSEPLKLPFSSELAFKVLETVPVIPVIASLGFSADGLPAPNYRDQDVVQEYRAKCNQGNIAPNSWIRFVPGPQDPFTNPGYEKGISLTPSDVLERRRIHQVSFKTGDYYPLEKGSKKTHAQSVKNSFVDLRERLADLRNKGYQPLRGELTLSGHIESGECVNLNCRDAFIEWDMSGLGHPLSLRLVINTQRYHSCDGVDADQLSEWFQSLKTKN